MNDEGRRAPRYTPPIPRDREDDPARSNFIDGLLAKRKPPRRARPKPPREAALHRRPKATPAKCGTHEATPANVPVVEPPPCVRADGGGRNAMSHAMPPGCPTDLWRSLSAAWTNPAQVLAAHPELLEEWEPAAVLGAAVEPTPNECAADLERRFSIACVFAPDVDPVAMARAVAESLRDAGAMEVEVESVWANRTGDPSAERVSNGRFEEHPRHEEKE